MFIASPLSLTFDELTRELVALERSWTSRSEREGLRYTAADLRHHVCALLVTVDDLPADRARYDALDGEGRFLAHEAFLAVLALGQLLLHAIADRLAPELAIARVQQVVDRLLDLITPLVSRADDALRRVLLEGVSIEAAVAEVGRGQ